MTNQKTSEIQGHWYAFLNHGIQSSGRSHIDWTRFGPNGPPREDSGAPEGKIMKLVDM